MYFAKKPSQPITVANFCEYYGVEASEVHVAMRATDLDKMKIVENRKNKPETAPPISDIISTKQIPYQFSRKTE